MGTVPHDLPPCPKVRVFKSDETGLWTWTHDCNWHGHHYHGGHFRSHFVAMINAQHHANRCVVA